MLHRLLLLSADVSLYDLCAGTLTNEDNTVRFCPKTFALQEMYNIPKNSGTSFLLLPDGGIVDMPVSAQKWELTKSGAPTSRNLARKCVGSSSNLRQGDPRF